VHRDDMKIAAKTGTAQVGSKEHPRQIAWLCGYFPADNPKYAFAVMIQGEDSDNHGLGLDDGLLGGREGGAIVAHVMDDMYGPPPNAKDRASNFEDYDKTEDITAADKAAAAAIPVAKKADPVDFDNDDGDATGLGGGNHASARSSDAQRTSSKSP
jgi:hypothetical protein